MNLQRIHGMMLRHWFGTLRSFDRLTDAFFWTAVDLSLWGVTAGYVQSIAPQISNVAFMITASVVLWSITYRGQIDISFGMLDELWNRNLVNIFVTPLTFSEWTVSLLLLGMAKAVVSCIFGILFAILLYNFNIFALSWWLLPFFILLLLGGWWTGLLISALILRFSTKVQALAWTFVWVFAPFSAIYFPVASLPSWAQSFAAAIPHSYVFEEMRRLIEHGTVDTSRLLISLALNMLYLTLGLIFLYASFKRTLQRGLAKVY